MTNSAQAVPAISVPHITVINGVAKTTSKDVAAFFGKRHTHVIRAIENIDCSAEFTSAHFWAHAETIKAGAVERPSKFYEMTKDGFTFLVMGFTGKEAARFKEAYINRFNEMEAALRATTPQQPAIPPAGLTPAQQRHIQHAVAALTKLHGRSFQAVYGSIKDQFRVGTYKDIPADQYPALCRFLNITPATGEYIPHVPAERPMGDTDLVNMNAMSVHALAVCREWNEVIRPTLEASGSRYLSRMFDHFAGLSFVAQMFRRKYAAQLAALDADEEAFRSAEMKGIRSGLTL